MQQNPSAVPMIAQYTEEYVCYQGMILVANAVLAMKQDISMMGYCKKDVTPVLYHWSYIFLALTHQYIHSETLWDILFG